MKKKDEINSTASADKVLESKSSATDDNKNPALPVKKEKKKKKIVLNF